MPEIIKERPILFSTEMVKAILREESPKTQTRRVCEDQGPDLEFRWVDNNPTFPEYWKGKKAESYTGWVVKYPDCPLWLSRDCPYGKLGDHLWVRETWAAIGFAAGLPIREMNKAYGDNIIYKADVEKPLYYDWRPSIHMPRWMSRITLQVTGVRVERLQEISEEDALAEGINDTWKHASWLDDSRIWQPHTSITWFAGLWDSINLKRGYGWDSNPWVWRVEFKRLPTPVEQIKALRNA